MRSFLLALTLMMAGCAKSLPEKVEIVAIQCEVRGGESDCRTIIERWDGTRMATHGRWGDEGDVFYTHLDGWWAP